MLSCELVRATGGGGGEEWSRCSRRADGRGEP